MNILVTLILIGLTGSILSFLYTANQPDDQRHQQDTVVIVATLFTLLCFLLQQLQVFFLVEQAANHLLAKAGFSNSPLVGTYLVYLLVPLMFYPVKKGLIRFNPSQLAPSFIKNYFYQKENNKKEFYLKNEFYYPLQYLKKSIIAFAILLLLGFLFAVPTYLFLLLFVLLEFYWFMNGKIKSTVNKPVLPTKEEINVRPNYHQLWKDYQTIWKDNLLQAFMLPNQNPPTEDSYTLEEESLVINYKQDKVFAKLSQQIIETVNQGKTIILFINDHLQPLIELQEREQFKIIEQLLLSNENSTRLYTTKLDSLKKDKRILVNSIDQFLNKMLNIENDPRLLQWFEDLGVVVYFGYDKSLIESPESTVSVSNILKYLCKTPQELTTIVFAEERQNAQAAFTSNIRVNKGFKQLRLQDQMPQLTLWLNWKRENTFEEGLFGKSYNHLLGPIACLLPLPYEHHVSTVIVKATNQAYLENFENLKNSKSSWLPKYASLKQIERKQIDQYIQYYNHPLSFNRSSEQVIFLDDNLNNAPLSLKYFNNFAEKISLVNIISAPHILRSYFNQHAEFFLAAPILPLSYLLLKEDRTTLALSLLEKLCKCKLTFEELYNDFSETNSGHNIILTQIKNLFIDVFNFDIIGSDYLEISKEEQGKFLFNLKPDIKNEIELFRQVDFRDENSELIFRKNKHLLYQKYSQGQFHSFNGRMYEISQIFDDSTKITIKLNNKKPQKNYFFYTEKRGIILRQDLAKEYCMNSNTVNNNEVSLHIYQNHFEVRTNGYFEFDQNGFSLKSGDFTTHQNKINTRVYKNGRLLKWNFKNVKDPSSTGIITLRIILEEISKVLFPDSYQFLIFRFFNDQSETDFSNTPKSLLDYYQLRNQLVQPNAIKGIGVCIFEDSMFDLGHLRSIKENWTYILQLVEDYLSHIIDSVGKQTILAKNIKAHQLFVEPPFLSFGLKKVKTLKDFPNPIDIEGARKIVSHALRNYDFNNSNNSLTRGRKGFYK